MILKIFAVLTVLLGVLYLYYPDGLNITYFKKNISNPKPNTDRLYTKDELKMFDGVNSQYLYLAILGKVYDVTSGKKHYGPGSNYNIFIGRDASKSFISGEFSKTNDDLDDVIDLSYDDLVGLENWSEMYDKQYIYKGKLIGRFYDEYGSETEYKKKYNLKFQEGKKEKSAEENLKKKYPPCNVEWDATMGSRVWCTIKSGGISRDWEGVPRLLYTPGVTEAHCVCINVHKNHLENQSNIKEYEGCHPESTSCYVIDTKN